VHIVIKPDVDCAVNSGLSSIRGSRMAENRRSDVNGTQQQRLTDPLVWRYGTWQPTSWDDALDLVARVTARVIDKDKENDLYVSMFYLGGTARGWSSRTPRRTVTVDSCKQVAVAARLGGHQNGYDRPSDAHVGRPAPYIDLDLSRFGAALLIT
jgi:anaerobic selenocysteine-containing dehydrogenase